MAHITLVRHGQANSASQDEKTYDKLSPLGHEQAEWLGAHLDATNQVFDRVYSGTLRRHLETAQAMNAARHAPIIRDARLNELEYFTLAHLYQQQTGVLIPTGRDEFVTHMAEMFTAWEQGTITGAPESFAQFEDRVSAAIAHIASHNDKALVVTSGGLIGMVTRQILGLDIEGYARMCLAIMNTSVHKLVRVGPSLSLAQFNSVAHLEMPGRHHAQTHI